jgi:uracil-DNA glycosylase
LEVKIHPSWYKILNNEFESPYLKQILNTVGAEISTGKIIYPLANQIFRAFEISAFEDIHVVILGQDPYHNKRQAMGLSFSVPVDAKIPASLKNIYKEIQSQLGGSIPPHGDLTHWAEQGVFLLNSILTVEKNKPGSHKNVGWQYFTDAVISLLSSHKKNIVFMLWGNYARTKKNLIDSSKHLILESAHPSPLARGGFRNNGHFIKCNEFLTNQGLPPINWI